MRWCNLPGKFQNEILNFRERFGNFQNFSNKPTNSEITQVVFDSCLSHRRVIFLADHIYGLLERFGIALSSIYIKNAVRLYSECFVGITVFELGSNYSL